MAAYRAAVLPYRLRNAVRWTPPIGQVRPIDLGSLAGDDERVRELLATYPTASWRRSVRPNEVAENFYVLDLLDRALPGGMSLTSGRALDVGCKGWAYLAAQRSAAPLPWDGVEVDAFARIGGLQTRASIARWRLTGSPECRFIPGSVTELTGPYRLVTWFLPFVVAGPHRRWGLPSSLFDPAGLLAHVWSMLEPGGVLVISNQGDAEAAVQRALFGELSIDAELLGPIASESSPFTHDRPVWRAIKPASAA